MRRGRGQAQVHVKVKSVKPVRPTPCAPSLFLRPHSFPCGEALRPASSWSGCALPPLYLYPHSGPHENGRPVLIVASIRKGMVLDNRGSTRHVIPCFFLKRSWWLCKLCEEDPLGATPAELIFVPVLSFSVSDRSFSTSLHRSSCKSRSHCVST